MDLLDGIQISSVFWQWLVLDKYLICPLWTWLNWTDNDWTSVNLKMWTHLIAIKYVGQFICSQLSVRADVRTWPAHSHLPCGYCLKLKVPLPLGDSIRLLCPEDSYLVAAGVLEAMASCSDRGKRWQITWGRMETLEVSSVGLRNLEFAWYYAFNPQIVMKHELTALLIWRLNVVAIANEGADSVVNTVPVGFFSSLVQQVVWYQTRVSLI